MIKLRLRRREKQDPRPSLFRFGPPVFRGILKDGRGFMHEMCAFCFGAGESCSFCEGRGYLLTTFPAEYTTAALAEHDRLGTSPIDREQDLQTFGHAV